MDFVTDQLIDNVVASLNQVSISNAFAVYSFSKFRRSQLNCLNLEECPLSYCLGPMAATCTDTKLKCPEDGNIPAEWFSKGTTTIYMSSYYHYFGTDLTMTCLPCCLQTAYHGKMPGQSWGYIQFNAFTINKELSKVKFSLQSTGTIRRIMQLVLPIRHLSGILIVLLCNVHYTFYAFKSLCKKMIQNWFSWCKAMDLICLFKK